MTLQDQVSLPSHAERIAIATGHPARSWWTFFERLHQRLGFSSATAPMYSCAACSAMSMLEEYGTGPDHQLIATATKLMLFDVGEGMIGQVFVPYHAREASRFYPWVRCAPSTNGSGTIEWELIFAVFNPGEEWSGELTETLTCDATGAALKMAQAFGPSRTTDQGWRVSPGASISFAVKLAGGSYASKVYLDAVGITFEAIGVGQPTIET